jgi:hypothetical protein
VPQTAAQPAVAADRFARKIVGILAACAVRSRQLNGNPLGGNHRTFQHLECPYQSNLSLCPNRMPTH